MKTHSHQWLDQRSLALHQLIAEKIRRDPALFENVEKTLNRWRTIVCANSQPYLKEWEQIVNQGIDACLAFAVEDSEHANAMRQASPFSGILTNEERWEFFLDWAGFDGASDQEIEELRQKMIQAQELLEKNDYFVKKSMRFPTQKDFAAFPLENVPTDEQKAVLEFIEKHGTSPGPPDEPPGTRRIWLADYRRWWDQQPGNRQRYHPLDFDGYWAPRQDELQKGLFRHMPPDSCRRPKWEDYKSMSS